MTIRNAFTAFSTALALAVMLATATTTAFAAKSENGPTKPPTSIDSTDKNPKYEQAKPGGIVNSSNTGPLYQQVDGGSIIDIIDPNPQPMFKPDVLVVYLDSTWNGTSRLHRFRVENVGIETATNVGLNNVVYQHSDTSNVAKRQEGSSGNIPSLATGQTHNVTVTCTPLPGYHCTSGALEAVVANDLNPANNSAHN
jgi:hypothetical protein